MRTFHRWRRSMALELYRGDPPPGLWRCEKCGAEVMLAVKPTRRRLRKGGLGETCEEWALREVMAQ